MNSPCGGMEDVFRCIRPRLGHQIAACASRAQWNKANNKRLAEVCWAYISFVRHHAQRITSCQQGVSKYCWTVPRVRCGILVVTGYEILPLASRQGSESCIYRVHNRTFCTSRQTHLPALQLTQSKWGSSRHIFSHSRLLLQYRATHRASPAGFKHDTEGPLLHPPRGTQRQE
jgi:hypothetical protein